MVTTMRVVSQQRTCITTRVRARCRDSRSKHGMTTSVAAGSRPAGSPTTTISRLRRRRLALSRRNRSSMSGCTVSCTASPSVAHGGPGAHLLCGIRRRLEPRAHLNHAPVARHHRSIFLGLNGTLLSHALAWWMRDRAFLLAEHRSTGAGGFCTRRGAVRAVPPSAVTIRSAALARQAGGDRGLPFTHGAGMGRRVYRVRRTARRAVVDRRRRAMARPRTRAALDDIRGVARAAHRATIRCSDVPLVTPRCSLTELSAARVRSWLAPRCRPCLWPGAPIALGVPTGTARGVAPHCSDAPTRRRRRATMRSRHSRRASRPRGRRRRGSVHRYMPARAPPRCLAECSDGRGTVREARGPAGWRRSLPLSRPASGQSWTPANLRPATKIQTAIKRLDRVLNRGFWRATTTQAQNTRA